MARRARAATATTGWCAGARGRTIRRTCVPPNEAGKPPTIATRRSASGSRGRCATERNRGEGHGKVRVTGMTLDSRSDASRAVMVRAGLGRAALMRAGVWRTALGLLLLAAAILAG